MKKIKIYNSHVAIEQKAIEQMEEAMRLPISIDGALMPDSHLGYGVPVGSVWATHNAIVPYAVGVDIGCTVMFSKFSEGYEDDITESELKNAIEQSSKFGIGAGFEKSNTLHNEICSDFGTEINELVKECEQSTVIKPLIETKMLNQLGTSGSGNHFLEAGYTKDFYMAFVSHSGSRGTGAAVCAAYTKIAKDLHPELSGEAKNLAWLDMDKEEGANYFRDMQLMVRYAKLNHKIIHRKIEYILNTGASLRIGHAHNFASKEFLDGKEVILHRKGATPASLGELGYIPGTMRDPGYIVKGKGIRESLYSASHGAGRAMSRTVAKDRFKSMDNIGIDLISAGLDEHPDAYKNIDDVMKSQKDLVDIVDTFTPCIVKMAPAGDKAED